MSKCALSVYLPTVPRRSVCSQVCSRRALALPRVRVIRHLNSGIPHLRGVEPALFRAPCIVHDALRVLHEPVVEGCVEGNRVLLELQVDGVPAQCKRPRAASGEDLGRGEDATEVAVVFLVRVVKKKFSIFKNLLQ